MRFKTYGPATNPSSKSASPVETPDPDAAAAAAAESPATLPPTVQRSIQTPGRSNRSDNIDGDDAQSPGMSAIMNPAAAEVQKHFLSHQPLQQQPNALFPLSMSYSDDQRYFLHFVHCLSGRLIIYDKPANMNPFRVHFPAMSRSSPSLAGGMQALAALHIAHMDADQQRSAHFQYAVTKYDEIVRLFRTSTETRKQVKVADLAVCLLLCLFEASSLHCSLFLWTVVADDW